MDLLIKNLIGTIGKTGNRRAHSSWCWGFCMLGGMLRRCKNYLIGPNTSGRQKEIRWGIKCYLKVSKDQNIHYAELYIHSLFTDKGFAQMVFVIAFVQKSSCLWKILHMPSPKGANLIFTKQGFGGGLASADSNSFFSFIVSLSALLHLWPFSNHLCHFLYT